MHSIKRLNVFHWNAQGISNFSTAKQLELFLLETQTDLVSLNETFLKDPHNFRLNGYKIYRNDRIGTEKGGVAIAVRHSIKHELLPPYKTKKIENISIELCINRRSVVFTSAYSPKYFESFEADIKKITPSNKEFIVLGDLNAKSTIWNCNRNNTAGNVLVNLQHRSDFIISYPPVPTHYPHSGTTPSTIDIMLTNSSLFISPITAHIDQLKSDHSPITCTIDADTTTNSMNKSLDYRRANWLSYESFLNSKIDLNADFDSSTVTESSVDAAVERLISLILEARDLAIPRNIRKCKTFDVSVDTKACIQFRNALNRQWKRCRDPVKKAELKSLINIANKKIDKAVFNDRNANFNDMLSNLKTGDKKFWKVTKAIRGKNSNIIGCLRDGDKVLFTNDEKVNAIADTFEKSHALTSNFKHSIDVKVERFNKQLKKDVHLNLNASTYATPREIVTIVKQLKSFKAPGIDGIQNILLKKLPSRAFTLITKIFNGCIKIGYFPATFKLAKVVPIPKPGKDHKLTTSFRPISLLSCIGKVFEKCIYARLSKFASINKIIAKEQFGFRSQHSTTHQVKRVVNLVKMNKRMRKSTGLILLDIEKAFDSVWHNGLIYKLNAYGTPLYLLKLIKSFITDRSFMVSLNGSYSNTRKIPAGVPQGSVLSPLLYSLYISDFKVPKNCNVSFYADDTGLMAVAKHTRTIINRLHGGLKMCQRYLKKWKIQLNATKTQAILFPFNKSPKRKPSAPLNFEGAEIKFTKTVTYLGMDLDEMLTFKSQAGRAAEKSSKALWSLYPLLSRKSKLSLRNKNLLFRCMIRPIMMYGCAVWHSAAKTHIKRLQVIQNKALKMINKLPWKYSTDQLHHDTKYDTVKEFMRKTTQRFDVSCANSDFELIRAIVE